MSRPRGTGRVITLDTEAIGLLPDIKEGDKTSLHVLVFKDRETDEYFVFFDKLKYRAKPRMYLDEWESHQDGSLTDAIKFINEADVVIAQNILGYDWHSLNKVFGGKLKLNYKAEPRGGKQRRKEYPFRVMDTLVMSQLLYPDRRPPPQAYAMEKGNVAPHSIEAHGIRIGRYKPENNDWTKLTDHMIQRCWEDTAIGDDFYDYLMKEWHEQSAVVPRTGLSIKDAYRMEAVMYFEMSKQSQRGFRLDINYAFELIDELDQETERILSEALPFMPMRIKKKKLDHTVMKAACKKAGHKYLIKGEEHGSVRGTNWNFINLNGNYSATTKKDYPQHAIGNINNKSSPVIIGPYTPVVWEQSSLGNRDAVRQTLYKLGWRGVNLTDGEEAYLEENLELPYFYAGKLDEDSIKAWEIKIAKKSKKRIKKGKKTLKVPTWAKDILKYYIVTHRRSQIFNRKDFDSFIEKGEFPKNGCRGLVPKSRCQASGKTFQELMELYGSKFWTKKQWDKDGEYRVPSECFAIGTNTFRCRHKVVVNIPARGLYGKEMRKLFIASKGYKLLGADASGLELRILSHFMQDLDYEHEILHGDIHNFNMDKGGFPDRDAAKKFIYSFIYGSGALGLSIALGIPVKTMKKIISQFLTSLPLLDELIKNVKDAVQSKGYVVAVDGRWGRVRKSGKEYKIHTALNVLLQMTGSLCVKWGIYLALEELDKAGIENRLVVFMHDEIGMEIPEKEVKTLEYKVLHSEWKEEDKRSVSDSKGIRYSAPMIVSKGKKKLTVRRYKHLAGHIYCKAFKDAGKLLHIRTPLDGEYKIGSSWAETH